MKASFATSVYYGNTGSYGWSREAGHIYIQNIYRKGVRTRIGFRLFNDDLSMDIEYNNDGEVTANNSTCNTNG